MATQTIVYLICDLPHNDDADAATDVEHVKVTTSAGTFDVDVCRQHARHFIDPLIGSGVRAKRQRRTRADADA